MVTFPSGRELALLKYDHAPEAAIPAGHVILDDSISRRSSSVQQNSSALPTQQRALVAAYRPGRTFAQAFADSLLQNLRLSIPAHFVDPQAPATSIVWVRPCCARESMRCRRIAVRSHRARSGPRGCRISRPGRSRAAIQPRYVLIDDKTGASRHSSASRPPPRSPTASGAGWHRSNSLSSSDLTSDFSDARGVPSPSAALLRPVFQDFLFSTSALAAGPC